MILNYILVLHTDQLVVDDPVLSLDDKYFLTREEAFDRAMVKSVHFVRRSRELGLDNLEKNIFKT